MSEISADIIEEGHQNNPIVLLEDGIDTKVDQTQSDGDRALVLKDDTCPYLSGVNRRALDFDAEKLCSVSLSKLNVYACLSCGRFFQGRNQSSHAFTHSIQANHHLFLNLETFKFYSLDEDEIKEVQDESLNDILDVLRPSFTKEQISQLDSINKPIIALIGRYYPGIVGLNNLKQNDYCNVIFQALSHVIPLRNYFLVKSSHESSAHRVSDERYLLAFRFGELLRKLWNLKNFKSHVSPHEMLQAIVTVSKKRFEFTKQGDPIVFLGWLLNSLLGRKREKNSIITSTFQGKLRIASRLLLPNVSTSLAPVDEPELIPADEEEFTYTSFLYLTMDLPLSPLFPKKDERGKVIKPRISIYDLMKKFDGQTRHEFRGYKESSVKRYEIMKLPQYLIIYYKRFTKNTFFIEKNTHLIDFPINNLDLTYLMTESTEGGNTNESIQDLSKQKYCYRLIANIVHDGDPEPGKGTYRVHVLHRGTGKWFELQDLYAKEMSDIALITLSEPYIQFWERTSDR